MYSWLVFLHLVGLVLFAVAHGASMFLAFRIRGERSGAVVAAHLATSQMAVGLMYVGLLLLGIGGLGAAWNGGLLTAPWVVGSYIVVVVVIGVMYAVASPYYRRLRELVGDGATVDSAALASAVTSRRPDVLAGVGALGLVVLTWLMVLKPG